LGRFDDALSQHQEAVRLNPNAALTHEGVARDYMAMDRFDEAKAVLTKAISKKIQYPAMNADLYEIAFIQHDVQAMEQELDWGKANPDAAGRLLNSQVRAAIFAGKISEARKLMASAQPESASDRWAPLTPVERAFLGLSLPPQTQPSNPLAVAIAGAPAQASKLIDETAKTPLGTIAEFVDLPASKAMLAIRAGNSDSAVALLNTAVPYERANAEIPYIRGLAYLQGKSGSAAAAEFQKVLDHRGATGFSVLYPLSQLGVARAAVLSGDSPKARKSYQDFLALWKDADPDIPVLIQAKDEYAKLK
jgi:tetratricopeptide (TPR) repeat protein